MAVNYPFLKVCRACWCPSKVMVMLLVAFVLPGPAAVYAEEAPAVEQQREVRYVELQPSFVTNYGFTENGRLKYVKTDVSVRVSDQQSEMAARYHLPALRNALILLLSAQDEAAVSTGGGREILRAQALDQLNEILEREEGAPMIDDLMFTNFVVQR